MGQPKNGEVRLPIDVPRKVRALLDELKKDTGRHYKSLVALAVYHCFKNPDQLTYQRMRKMRIDYEEWLEGKVSGASQGTGRSRTPRTTVKREKHSAASGRRA